MTDQQENNQILTQQSQTISQDIDEFDLPAFTDTDEISTPTATTAEISPVERDLNPTNEQTENSTEISPVANDLTPASELTETPAETYSVANDLTPASELTETPAETYSLEGDLTPAEISSETAQQENDLTTPTALTQSAIAIPPTPPTEDDFTPAAAPAENPDIADRSPSRESAAETMQTSDIIVVDTWPEIQPVKIPAIAPEDATATSAENPTANSEPKPTKIWQLLTVFMSGMLVGSVLSLGTLVAWRLYQERANIQIKLPADVPLPPSPSPTPTVPARQQLGIPPAPGTAPPLPTNNPTNNPINNPTNNPSPNPTQIPSLSGVPPVASPALPSPPEGGNGGSVPTNSPSPISSPSPAAETAVTERVSFAAGATGTTLSNTLPDNKSKRYLVDCRSGQTMTLNVPEGAVSATIIAPNGETVGTANSTTPWQGQLPTSGDYTIEISGESQANYGVKIEVK
ncbi:MAG: hypothetical protein MUE44_22790 [Oscillatoriaceae cyanobacterium Prado104]|jgi:hypothetical protein|nr:hypothetical protein [Oscillatoriaceae cyanobacterium Prado104]